MLLQRGPSAALNHNTLDKRPDPDRLLCCMASRQQTCQPSVYNTLHIMWDHTAHGLAHFQQRVKHTAHNRSLSCCHSLSGWAHSPALCTECTLLGSTQWAYQTLHSGIPPPPWQPHNQKMSTTQPGKDNTKFNVPYLSDKFLCLHFQRRTSSAAVSAQDPQATTQLQIKLGLSRINRAHKVAA